MSLAIFETVYSEEILGAERIKFFTLVDAGSSLDLRIHRLVITPAYFPLASNTASTGGNSVLNDSRHLDNVSFSFTELTPLV
jgi:hypothetical protein